MGRNMFRLSSSWEKLENVEEHPSMFILACANLGLCVQACSCARNLYSFVRRLVLVRMYLFFSLYARRFHLRMRAKFFVCMVPSRNLSLGILALFSSVFYLFATLTSCFTIFCTQLYAPCHISSYCESNIIFAPFFSLNHDFNPILFLHVSAPYSGEVPVKSWCCTTSILRRLKAISVLRVLSPSSIWCLKGPPVLS